MSFIRRGYEREHSGGKTDLYVYRGGGKSVYFDTGDGEHPVRAEDFLELICNVLERSEIELTAERIEQLRESIDLRDLK